MSSIEQRHRIRLALMARRSGCRVSRPKPDDPVERGGYRLYDLVNNRVLLGEEFEPTLAEIEAYLRQERNPKKTPRDSSSWNGPQNGSFLETRRIAGASRPDRSVMRRSIRCGCGSVDGSIWRTSGRMIYGEHAPPTWSIAGRTWP